jgi:hypothetical protein
MGVLRGYERVKEGKIGVLGGTKGILRGYRGCAGSSTGVLGACLCACMRVRVCACALECVCVHSGERGACVRVCVPL